MQKSLKSLYLHEIKLEQLETTEYTYYDNDTKRRKILKSEILWWGRNQPCITCWAKKWWRWINCMPCYQKARRSTYLIKCDCCWKDTERKLVDIRKAIKKMTNNYVLYTKMLMSSLYEKILISLQVLLRNKELCKPEVLQWKMQERCNDSKKENNTMHKLLNWYIPTITLDKILLYGLQKFTSFKKYALKIKSKLQTLTCIRQLSKRFLQSKKRNYLKRLMSMCNMLNKWKSCSSSQRQQSIKQRLQQLNNSLYKTSCNTSSQQNITVSSVISLDKTETVYDIQVAWNENFYANGILVHNCMLIDDPWNLMMQIVM